MNSTGMPPSHTPRIYTAMSITSSPHPPSHKWCQGKPSCINLLYARNTSSMQQEDVSLLSDQLGHLTAEVCTEPIQEHDGALLGASRRFQAPVEEVHDVVGPIGPAFLELNQKPWWHVFHASANACAGRCAAT